MSVKFFLTVAALFLTSCANVSTTTFQFNDALGNTLRVEMPKELDAENLVVEINAKKATATIRAKKITTSNVGTITAQAGREKVVAGAIAKGVVEGAIVGAKFIP